MAKKNLVLALSLLTVLLILWPAATQAQQGSNGNFVFINYIGQEITLDLDDVTYTVPGTNTAPEGGRLTLTLPAGEHKFAANVPGGPPGYAGEFTIRPGQVVGKAARIDQTGPALDNNGVLLVPPRDFVQVFDVDPLAQPVTPPAVIDTWQPATAAPAMGSLVWINYLGDELTVDLSGTLYKVLPKNGDIPGRLQIDVAPGTYRYTTSVPAGSLNSEVTVVAGQVSALNITADPPEPLEYKVGKKLDIPQPLDLKLFEEDLTPQAATAAEPVKPTDAPATLPNTGGQLDTITDNVPAVEDGLLIKNYAGDTLIFTINNQTYTIPNNAERTLPLEPNQYTYTASIPGVAASGLVALNVNRSVELSIAINVDHNVLSVYKSIR